MSRPAILTVDDDPQVSAAITRDLVTQYGAEYRVIRASSGPEALSVLGRLHLRAGEEPGIGAPGLGSGTPDAGLRGMRPSRTARVRTSARTRCACRTVAGARPPATSWATHAATSAWVTSASRCRPQRGRIWTRSSDR